jgi:predicted Rossmann fold flavoprotein
MGNATELFDCAVIGAGASGMMAAVTAARCGGRVLLVEHGKRAGRKLLATGNGKCNFTNAYMDASCYRGNDTLFPILEQFSKEDTLSFFHEIGIYPREKRGYYYPLNEQASSVVGAFEKELKRLAVRLLTETDVMSVTKDCGFLLATTRGTYRAKTVIFATGLLASPKLGSDGSAFDLIKGFGHRFTRLVPALCGFYAEGIDWKKVAGVRCDACVRFFVDGESVASDTGELQLTEYGISGIPVFQVSRFASVGLAQKRRVEASIRFLPGMTGQEILDEFRFRLGRADGAVEAYDLLDGLLNQKLIPVLLDKAGLSVHSRVTEPEQAAPLAEVIQNLWLTLQKPRDYEFAQVCAGGIATEDIDTGTLMSRLVPGLFFCGELLDVDGICGGYNLQWAWSSGFVAGRGAVQS